MKPMEEQEARREILDRVADYCSRFLSPEPYSEGGRIPYAGRVFDARELTALVDSALDFWLTSGRYAEAFERGLAGYLGVRFCALTNSGSSALLLAFSALTAPELGEKRIRRGDEVITVSAGFPTTVTPVLQYGAVPVFVDVDIPSYNINPALLEQALSERTKAVLLAHTLGNPFDLAAVKAFCDRHGLWLIEDNCDALGAEYTLDGRTIKTGAAGHLGCSSFYPAHHMTMGEGGAVYTDDPLLDKLVRSFRDWGRDCTCPSGVDGSCGHRFSGRFGALPQGYDHKYVYSHFGYNLKATEMQAAIGCAQLEKLPRFVEARRENWAYLRSGLEAAAGSLILPEPQKNARPSWFGFALTLREGSGLVRADVARRLEARGIQTRNLFAGNFVMHPCFDELRRAGRGYRVAGELPNTNRILSDTFWVGVYPGLTRPMLDAMIQAITDAART